jgi:hypothetical protein
VKEKLPFSIQQDDKKLHKVVLSDFAISKFKVTNADYTAYLKSTGKKPPVNILVKDYPSLAKDNYSVGVTWQQAKDYCQWLGKVSGKRSTCRPKRSGNTPRGPEGNSSFATNNGEFEKGKNIPGEEQLDEYTDGMGLPIYPIGKYPQIHSGFMTWA